MDSSIAAVVDDAADNSDIITLKISCPSDERA
jgi:hypothetical protein